MLDCLCFVSVQQPARTSVFGHTYTPRHARVRTACGVDCAACVVRVAAYKERCIGTVQVDMILEILPTPQITAHKNLMSMITLSEMMLVSGSRVLSAVGKGLIVVVQVCCLALA